MFPVGNCITGRTVTTGQRQSGAAAAVNQGRIIGNSYAVKGSTGAADRTDISHLGQVCKDGKAAGNIALNLNLVENVCLADTLLGHSFF